MKQLTIVAIVLLAFAAIPAFGTPTLTPCPILTGGTSGGEGVSSTYITDTAGGTTNGCNVLITFNSNGSITTTFPNAAPSYDAGEDDNLVGIINNSSAAITSVVLTNTALAIFGFDLDGVCGDAATGALDSPPNPGYTFAGGGNACTNAVDKNAYGGPFITFSGINGTDTSGTVNFGNGGIAANGGTTWFSLEGPVSLSLIVGSVPEPASLALVGLGLAALGWARRRMTR